MTVDLPLSGRLQTFFTALFNKAADECGAVLLRDFERFPQVGFDCDVLTDRGRSNAFADIARQTAEQDGLVVVSKANSELVRVAVFDFSNGSENRKWLILDVVEEVAFSQDILFGRKQLDTDSVAVGGGFVAVPTPNWRILLGVLQGARKGAVKDVVLNDFRERMSNDELMGFMEKKLPSRAAADASLYCLDATINDRQRNQRLAALACLLHVRPYRLDNQLPNAKTRIRRWVSGQIYRKLPFLEIHKSRFVAVIGPDGAGKSTTIDLLQSVLAQYPIGFAPFHHTSEWKKSRKAGGDDPQVQRPGIFWRIVESVRPMFPLRWRKFVRPLLTDLLYIQKVNGILADLHFSGNLGIADRYCYDRWLKLKAAGNRSADRVFAWWTCAIMRRPLLAVLLVGSPKDIHDRKPELGIDEIALYVDGMCEICGARRVRTVEFSSTDNSPEWISVMVARSILEVLGADFFSFASTWERQHAKARK